MSADRNVVPIPMQITSTLRGAGPCIANVKCAISFVIGESVVMSVPLT